MAKKKTQVNKTLPEVVRAEDSEVGFPVEAGSKGALVAHLLESMEIARHTDRNDIGSLKLALRDYLTLCARNNVNVTNMGLYGALGLSQETISQWASGKSRGTDPRYKDFALFVRKLCAQYRELAASEGKINVALAIWWQKNYDGFKDDPAVEKIDEEIAAPVDPDEIAAKYRHLLTDDSGARMEAERAKREVALPDDPEDEDE
jgi:hypothetical protein